MLSSAYERARTGWELVAHEFRMALAMDDRAQGTNLVGLFIGILIAAIVAVDVFIPVIMSSKSDSNASATTLTILDLLPLFAALLLLIALASPLMRRI